MDFELEEKKTEDWSQKWKEKWDVTHVTDKIAVVPDWIDYKAKEEDGKLYFLFARNFLTDCDFLLRTIDSE